MMQPAESLVRKDATRGDGTHPVAWCSLPESEMGAVVMIVTNIFGEQPLQMPFIHCNDVIQQVSSAAFDPTLRHAVLPGTLEGSLHWTQLQGSNRHRYFQSVFRILIEDQKPGSRPKRKRLSQLLDDPLACGVTCNVEVQHTPPIMVDDEEAIEHAERKSRNREEIHRSNGFPMIVQKRKPALGWFGISRRSFHPARDRSLGDIKTKHEEFTMNARGTPC
jgi:hypothetical protein